MSSTSKTSSKMSQEILAKPSFHSFAELKDVHAGHIGFVVGNGWSSTYYDVDKMAKEGVLIGCNQAFRKFPVDYLVWQDSSVDGECACYAGPKITSRRKGRIKLSTDSTYIFGFKKKDGVANKDGNLRLMHSGGLALQIAYTLGCNPIVLVGCDCRIFKVDGQDVKYKGYRSNIFADKQVAKFTRKGDTLSVNGKYTNNHLKSFMRKLEQVYEQLKDHADIYMLGPWSISTTIPWVEWKGYWSPDHPERLKV